MSKKYFLTIFSFLLLFVVFFNLFYPLELEIQESATWLQILYLKKYKNIFFTNDSVVFSTLNHGFVDLFLKYFLSFFLIDGTIISRSTTIIFYFYIFYFFFSNLKNLNDYKYKISISIFYFLLIFLFTKFFYGRSDYTASLFLLIAVDFSLKKKNKELILLFLIMSSLANWRFLFTNSIFIFYLLNNTWSNFYYFSNYKNFFKFFLYFTFILFIFVFFFFKFDLEHFKNIFLNETNNNFFFKIFELNYFNIFIKKLFFEYEKLIILLIFISTFFQYFFSKDKTISYKCSILFLIVLVNLILFYLNFYGGGVYYFLPTLISLMYFEIYILKLNRTKIIKKINLKKIISVIIIFFSVKALLVSIFFQIKDFHVRNNVKIFLNENQNIIYSDTIHFFKNKFSYETIDRPNSGECYLSKINNCLNKFKIIREQKIMKDLENGKFKYIILTSNSGPILKKYIQLNSLKKKYNYKINYGNIKFITIYRNDTF